MKSTFPAIVKSTLKTADPAMATVWEAVLVCEEEGRRSVEREEEVDSDWRWQLMVRRPAIAAPGYLDPPVAPVGLKVFSPLAVPPFNQFHRYSTV